MIIAASEHAAAERLYNVQRLSHEAAVQDLESARAKADANALQIARLKLENATARKHVRRRLNRPGAMQVRGGDSHVSGHASGGPSAPAASTSKASS